MIERYSRAEMEKIWSLENKYKTWLQVELAHLEVLTEQGVVPKSALQTIQKKATFDVEEIETLEKTLKHDVLAFLTNVSQKVGAEARHLHFGLTSSDVLDSSFALQLKQASEIILSNIEGLLDVLKEKAQKYKGLVTVGRSHGIHGEPTSFGLKFALWYSEMTRNKKRLQIAMESVSYGKFSGAVGNFAYLSPGTEESICKKLGLKAAAVSTQVIQRDRHAEFFSVLAILAGTIEKIAVEIRHLQRTEVLEVEEPFTKGQKGSSAMPHKKNPVLSENLTGLARLVRSNAQAAFENIALWHERDISHSSVERVIAPDSTILCDFMLSRLTPMLKDLVVHEDNVLANVDKTHGLVYSQRVLLELTHKGVTREKAYGWVQRNALICWEKKESFLELLKKDHEVSEALTEKALTDCFNPTHYLKHVDAIYRRVF